MKRIIFSCALLLLLVGATSLAPSEKYKFTASEAKLSVTFPCEFTTTDQVEESYKSVKTQGIGNDMVFFVNYTIHDNEMTDNEGLAQVSLDAFIEGLEGKVTQQSTWKVNKKNGIKALIAVPQSSLIGEYRVVILDQIQYQIMAVSPEVSWDEKIVKKFLKSFKVSK